MKKNALDVLNVAIIVINNLSGNLTGGALLTNVLYGLILVGMNMRKVKVADFAEVITGGTPNTSVLEPHGLFYLSYDSQCDR